MHVIRETHLRPSRRCVGRGGGKGVAGKVEGEGKKGSRVGRKGRKKGKKNKGEGGVATGEKEET